jgi:hypothetical protein
VLEAHLESWFAPWWAVPGRQALRETLRSLSVEFRREPQETWRRKLRRTRQAFRDAFAPVSDHDRTLEERDAAAPRYERSA